MRLLLIISILIFLVTACSPQAESLDTAKDAASENHRWYKSSQVSLGERIYADYCASCHGDQAQGLTADWKKKLADGSYPPPPLNGTAHAWHHPLPQLLRTIEQGGVPLGGVMPGFADKLNDNEKLAVIAYFQSYWPDEIYQHWLERGGLGNDQRLLNQ